MSIHPKSLIGIPDFEVDAIHENGDTLLIVMHDPGFVPPAPPCLSCGSVLPFHKHSAKERRCRDLNQDGKLTELLLVVPRFKCQDCQQVFTKDISDIVGFKEQYTKRFKREIQRLSLDYPFAQVGRMYDIPETTTKKFFMELVAEKEKNWVPYSPFALGLDEAHLGSTRKTKRIFGSFVDLSGPKAKFLDITESRKLPVIVNYLRNLPNNHNIQVVVTDMWAPYRDAVRSVLPWAKLVCDQFHVVVHANNSVNRVRIAEQSRANFKRNALASKMKAAKHAGDEVEWRRLKGQKKVHDDDYNMLKSRVNAGILTSNDENNQAVPSRMSMLKKILSRFPNIRIAYQLKEDIRSLYILGPNSRARAEADYQDWKLRIPPDADFDGFRTMAGYIDNWHEEVFNYHDFPYSNGKTESINRIIKEAYESGKGYSFDVLRYKVRYTRPEYRVDPKFIKMDKFGSVMAIITSQMPEYFDLLKLHQDGKPLPEDYQLSNGSGLDLAKYEMDVIEGIVSPSTYDI